jgi:hypothetical protein
MIEHPSSEHINHHGSSTTPSLPATSSLLQAEPFSQRITDCRSRFLAADGRFTPEQITSISGSGDGFDGCSFHVVSGEPSTETGIVRITIVHPLLTGDDPRLPFQHFYPEYTTPLQNGDAEISRFLVAPEARKGKATSRLIEAAFRICAIEHTKRLFIDVVDGNLGVSPKSYEKHFGFSFTGHTGYDDNYSCLTHLMVLEGADKIRVTAEKLTARLARI